MTFKTLCAALNKPEKTMLTMLRMMGLSQDLPLRLIPYAWFDYTTYSILKQEFAMKKQDYIERVRDIIEKNPFIDMSDVTKLLCRPASYTQWLITEMSFSESDLAETDDGLLFFVSDEIKER